MRRFKDSRPWEMTFFSVFLLVGLLFTSTASFGAERVCVSADGRHAIKLGQLWGWIPDLTTLKSVCENGNTTNFEIKWADSYPVSDLFPNREIETADDDGNLSRIWGTEHGFENGGRYMTCNEFKENYTEWNEWNPCASMITIYAELWTSDFHLRDGAYSNIYMVSELGASPEMQYATDANGDPKTLATETQIRAEWGDSQHFSYNTDLGFAVRDQISEYLADKSWLSDAASQFFSDQISQQVFGGSINAAPGQETTSSSVSVAYTWKRGEAPGLKVSPELYAGANRPNALNIQSMMQYITPGAWGLPDDNKAASKTPVCTPGNWYIVGSYRPYNDQTANNVDNLILSPPGIPFSSNNGYWYCEYEVIPQNAYEWRIGSDAILYQVRHYVWYDWDHS